MKIQILGAGCLKCQKLEKNAKEAVAELGLNAEVLKITDSEEIMNMGVMITPGFAIDSVVKSFGKVLSKEQIVKLLQ